MADCKACGAWFGTATPQDLCPTCERAMNRLKNYAVPVVRCKDCKQWMKDVPGCTDFVGRCALANYMIGATGYCLYGERKEGEG